MSFKRLDPEDFLISANNIYSPAWSNYSASLIAPLPFSTAQQSSNSGLYYLNVYNIDPTNPTAEIQFAIAYGDALGYGTARYNDSVDGL